MHRRLAASLCLIGLAWPVLAHHGAHQAVNRELEGWVLGAFSLVDHDGRDFTPERLNGRWTFMVFGDTTTCAQSCGAALNALAGVYQRMARTDALKTTQMVFVSLDPQRDTPARLREYLARFDSRFVGATAAPAMVQRLADDMGAGVNATNVSGSGGLPRYRGSVLLIGPDASLRAEYLPPLDVAQLTSAYLRARRGSR